MITTSRLPNGDVLVTFMIDDTRPVSVVGDFNDWDPTRHPVVDEPDGHRCLTVSLQADAPVAFRYLAEGGDFYDDPTADRIEPNGYGQTHSVLDASLRVDPQTSTVVPPARADSAVPERTTALTDPTDRSTDLITAPAN